jgi:hypothetical protein
MQGGAARVVQVHQLIGARMDPKQNRQQFRDDRGRVWAGIRL